MSSAKTTIPTVECEVIGNIDWNCFIHDFIYSLNKILLSKFLHKYPDQPPEKKYTASNRNSLIDWNLQSGGPQLARRVPPVLYPVLKI